MDKTITKADYLKLCVNSIKGIDQKNWYICAFTIPIWKEHKYTGEENELDLIIQQNGLHCMIKEEEGLVPYRINDHKLTEPLFTWQDKLTVDNTWLPNITGKIETVLGRLLINAIVFVRVCGDRIPYLNKPKMQVSDIEGIIIANTRNKEDLKPGNLTVGEMVKCIDNLNFFKFVATFTSVAATVKTITAAPGTKKFRDDLLKEYGDDIQDPVKLVEFEEKLMAFDQEYLKDDPAAAAIFGAKTRASRSKTHYFYGKGLDFVDSKDNDTIIKQSLGEGVEAKPEEFSKHFNDLRYASFSRGSNTALAGYTYKILQRSLSGISISLKPCNTTKGYVRTITGKESSKLVGRSIKVGGKWVLINTQAESKALEGKTVELRSSMYCTSPKNSICYACMSESYKGQENAVTNIAAGITSVFLNAFLKLMHNSKLTVTDINIDDLIR